MALSKDVSSLFLCIESPLTSLFLSPSLGLSLAVCVRIWCGTDSGTLCVYDLFSGTSRILSASLHRSAIIAILEVTPEGDDPNRGSVVCTVDNKGSVVTWHRDSLSELGKMKLPLSRVGDEPVVR